MTEQFLRCFYLFVLFVFPMRPSPPLILSRFPTLLYFIALGMFFQYEKHMLLLQFIVYSHLQ